MLTVFWIAQFHNGVFWIPWLVINSKNSGIIVIGRDYLVVTCSKCWICPIWSPGRVFTNIRKIMRILAENTSVWEKMFLFSLHISCDCSTSYCIGIFSLSEWPCCNAANNCDEHKQNGWALEWGHITKYVYLLKCLLYWCWQSSIRPGYKSMLLGRALYTQYFVATTAR